MPDHNIERFIGKTISGEDFIGLFPNLYSKLIKLTNHTENHKGFQFKTGLNTDMENFISNEEYNEKYDKMYDGKYDRKYKRDCNGEGIYFTDIDNMSMWLKFTSSFNCPFSGEPIYYQITEMEFCRTVELPLDCRVCIGETKFKADKIILGERISISQMPIWSDTKYCYVNLRDIIRRNLQADFILERIRKPYRVAEFAAVNHDYDTIKYLVRRGAYIPEKYLVSILGKFGGIIDTLIDHKIQLTEEMQLAAMKQNGYAIKYLLESEKYRYLSEEMMIAALGQNPQSIIHIIWHNADPNRNNINITENMLLAAVKKDGNILEILLPRRIEVSEKVIRAALEQNGEVIRILIEHDKKNKTAYVTEELKLFTITNSQKGCTLYEIIKSGSHVSEKMKMEAAIKHYDSLHHLFSANIHVSEEVQITAIKNNWKAIENIIQYVKKTDRYISDEIQIAAIEKSYDSVISLVYHRIPISEKAKLVGIKIYGDEFKRFLSVNNISVPQGT